MNKIRRVTMQDIADVAGVTPPTVSMALRNHHQIPKKTCEHIQALAKKMGYQLNPMMSAVMSHLRTRKNFPFEGSIAYISNWKHPDSWKKRSTFSGFFEGGRIRAERAGYKLEHFWAKDYKSERGLDRSLKARGIQGVVIMPFGKGRVGHLTLDWNHYSAAAVGFAFATPKLHYACCNHQSLIRIPLRKLKQLGYRRIGLAIDEDIDLNSDFLISLRFQQYLQQIPLKQCVPMYIPVKLAEDEHGFRKWYDEHRPDAIICYEPLMVEWLEKLGLNVPKDVGVAYMDISDKDPKTSGWAGVHQFSEEVGAAAVDLVLDQLYQNQQGIARHPKAVLIDPEWVQGKTVRPPLTPTVEVLPT